MKYLLLIPVLVLTGCATGPLGTVTGGGANYSYTKTADGCKVEINSARDIVGGTIRINGETCDVTVETAQAGGTTEALDVINQLVGKIK